MKKVICLYFNCTVFQLENTTKLGAGEPAMGGGRLDTEDGRQVCDVQSRYQSVPRTAPSSAHRHSFASLLYCEMAAWHHLAELHAGIAD